MIAARIRRKNLTVEGAGNDVVGVERLSGVFVNEAGLVGHGVQ